MDVSTFITLLLIGLTAGIASGYIGIGGGIIIIPALIYFLKLDQYQAQGVSLALMLPPIGILAFYSYFQAGTFNLVIEGVDHKNLLIYYALVMAFFFVFGGWIGSKFAFKTPIHIVQLLFGLFMLYASIKMIINGVQYYIK
jgi:uncharacterized membrane protein YfcA